MEWNCEMEVAVLLHLKRQGIELVIDNETIFDAQQGKYRIEAKPENGGDRVRVILHESDRSDA